MFKSQIISPMTLDRITLNAQTIKYPAMLKYINWVLVKVDRAQTHRAGQCIHTGGRQMVSQVIIGKAWPSTKVVTCLEEAMLPACSKPLVDFEKKCRSRDNLNFILTQLSILFQVQSKVVDPVLPHFYIVFIFFLICSRPEYRAEILLAGR